MSGTDDDRMLDSHSSKRSRWTKKMIEVVKRLWQAGREAAFYFVQQSAGGSDLITELVPTDNLTLVLLCVLLPALVKQLVKAAHSRRASGGQREDRDI